MASIRKRGNNYQIRVSCGYDITGKQLEKTMTYTPVVGMTKKQIEKEVSKIAFEFEQKCLNGLILDGNIKIAEFAEKWIKEHAEKQLKRKTVYRYKTLLPRINKAIGHIRLSKLQPFHLIEFYNNLSEEGIREDIRYKAVKDIKALLSENNLTQIAFSKLSGVGVETLRSIAIGKNVTKKTVDKIQTALNDNTIFVVAEGKTKLADSTIKHYHAFLSSMLSSAVEWQMIPYNPCTRVKPPKVKEAKQSFLDNEQAIDFLIKLNDMPLKYRALTSVYIDTGARRGEILGLEWPDLIADKCLLKIDKESLYLPGIGIFDDTPKNESSERLIKISLETVKLLLEWKREQAKTRLLMGDQWKGSKKIFTSNSGGAMHPDTVTGWITAFAKENGFENIHPHSLRHTNATLLIANGTDIRTVANRLGHTKASTTTNIYSHALKMADEMAAEKLSEILFKRAVN